MRVPRLLGLSVVAVIVCGLLSTYLFSRSYGLNRSETIALGQAIFSVIALMAILYSLWATGVQLRKSMAKPRLGVVFSENSSSEISLTIPQSREVPHILKLSVVNKGNAITKLFQIDFVVPTIFDPKLEPTQGQIPQIAYAGIIDNPRRNPDMTSTIFYSSAERVYAFVNKAVPICMLRLTTLPREYTNYPREFNIKYFVHGDWAETQEGVLKVTCSKT